MSDEAKTARVMTPEMALSIVRKLAQACAATNGNDHARQQATGHMWYALRDDHVALDGQVNGITRDEALALWALVREFDPTAGDTSYVPCSAEDYEASITP
ncbi:MAG TPA: hypothetical protein VKZ82_23860 [Nonomuraea sp.]|jgi:hypothetical protein|nr:hypothetical protein [Nonomuraea sp.]